MDSSIEITVQCLKRDNPISTYLPAFKGTSLTGLPKSLLGNARQACSFCKTDWVSRTANLSEFPYRILLACVEDLNSEDSTIICQIKDRITVRKFFIPVEIVGDIYDVDCEYVRLAVIVDSHDSVSLFHNDGLYDQDFLTPFPILYEGDFDSLPLKEAACQVLAFIADCHRASPDKPLNLGLGHVPLGHPPPGVTGEVDGQAPVQHTRLYRYRYILSRSSEAVQVLTSRKWGQGRSGAPGRCLQPPVMLRGGLDTYIQLPRMSRSGLDRCLQPPVMLRSSGLDKGPERNKL